VVREKQFKPRGKGYIGRPKFFVKKKQRLMENIPRARESSPYLVLISLPVVSILRCSPFLNVSRDLKKR
jgi:hypothetical protein